MNRLYVVLDENTNVASAVRQMNSQNAETIIVSKNGRPAGIVTDSDILDQVVMKGEDSDQVFLKAIMSKPLVTISPRGTIRQALQLMRINQVKRLPVVADGSEVLGIVTQVALANAVRTSVLEKTFSHYRSGMFTEKYKPILGNLGILLQFSGVLLVVPAFIGAALGESTSATGILFAVIGLSFAGFFLTHIGEKGPMNLKQASIFIVSGFLLLSLFGSIPYIYLDPFRPSDEMSLSSLFVNSFFESASGFTTTGLSIISNPQDLPKSLDFYHSYTQWVGGLSFMYLVMIIFFPERKLNAMKSVLGGGMLRVKELLITIVVIFTAYTIILVLAMVFVGQTDVLNATALVFSSITGGGFLPDTDLISPLHPERMTFVAVGMILSALPFAFHYYIFAAKSGLRERRTISLEVAVFFLVMAASIPIFYVLAGGLDNTIDPAGVATATAEGSDSSNRRSSSGDVVVDIYSAAFHVLSSATTTGFQYLNIQSLSPVAKMSLILLMLVGGTAFSTAGGIKIGRFVILYQELAKKAKEKTTTTASSPSPPIATGSTSTSTSISSTANPYRSSEFFEGLQEHNQKKQIDAEEEKIDRQKATHFVKRVKVTTSKKIVREILLVISLYISISVATGYIISVVTGSSLEDALFESVSAISTAGLTAGITSVDLDPFSKLILAANMIVGRFEIIAILYIFFSYFRK
nr:potassium transporter TrkG [Candidatus Nitrososphaera evergladensis]